MATYSKKQMQPLIDKYQIDPEANKLFQEIVEMFDGKPNYQFWAVKVIFSKAIDIDKLKEIKQFIETYSQSISQLSKQNITSYNCKTHFALLKREMSAIKTISFLKNQFMQFNTEQKKMLNEEILGRCHTLEAVYSDSVIKNWLEVFEKFDRLSPGRKQNFHSNCSAIKSTPSLMSSILDAINDSYVWNREDFLAFMQNNTKGCDVVIDRDNILVVKIPTFEASKMLCGNGRTQWCITTGSDHWRRYVTNYGNGNGKREQFFLFDFNKRETDELAHVGFTIEAGKGIDLAYSNTDRDIKSGYIDYKFPGESSYQKVNIFKCLSKLNLDIGSFMTMKDSKYEWNLESAVKFIKGLGEKSCKVAYCENNIVVATVMSKDACVALVEHTFINTNNLNFEGTTQNFVLLDFNLPTKDSLSLVSMVYRKDIYGSMSPMRSLDSFGTEVNMKEVLEKKALSEEAFVNDNEIDPCILFHKYIDMMEEDKAIELLNKYGEDFNINYEFNQRTPVFNAIANRMYKLFKLIVEHPKFDPKISDGFGETLLESLIFQYGLKDDLITAEEKESIANLISEILESDDYDFNCLDMNDDTALNVSCEYPEMNWITEKLLQKPNININQINFFGLAAIGSAITYHNIGAIQMLAQRDDLVITPLDLKIADAEGVNIRQYINVEAHMVAEATASAR